MITTDLIKEGETKGYIKYGLTDSGIMPRNALVYLSKDALQQSFGGKLPDHLWLTIEEPT